MKSIKKILLIILLFIISISCVNALDSFTATDGGADELNGSNYGAHWIYHLKYSTTNNYLVFCIGKWNVGWTSGTTYSKATSQWDTKIAAGVAAIIKEGVGSSATTTQSKANYYNTQIAIWKFLSDKGYQTQPSGEYSLDQNVTETVSTLVSKGNEAYNKSYTHSLNLSASTLTFNLVGDEYVSDPITVSGDDLNEVTTSLSAPTGSMVIETDANTNRYVVSVPKSAVTSDTQITVQFDSKGTKFDIANKYVSDDSQDLTISVLDQKQETASKSISGTISKTYSLKVAKVDTKGNFIVGAGLVFRNISDKTDTRFSEPIVSGTSFVEITNLKAGKYLLFEGSAPDGYYIDSTEYNIEIKTDGSILVNNVAQSNNEIKIVDDKIKVVVSKVSEENNNKEIEGAVLQILNSSKQEMSCTFLDENGEEKILDKCTWESGDTAKTIVGLNTGKYYLKEVSAPDGYNLTDELVAFEVSDSKKVINVTMKNKSIETEDVVEVPDTMNSKSVLLLSVAMIDIAIGLGIIVYVKKNKTA